MGGNTVVVMVDGLTKNVAAAMTAHTEPMANLTAQLKRVAAELPSHANTVTPKTIRRWLAWLDVGLWSFAPDTDVITKYFTPQQSTARNLEARNKAIESILNKIQLCKALK